MAEYVPMPSSYDPIYGPLTDAERRRLERQDREREKAAQIAESYLEGDPLKGLRDAPLASPELVNAPGEDPVRYGLQSSEDTETDPRREALARIQRGGLSVPDDAGQRWRGAMDAQAQEPSPPDTMDRLTQASADRGAARLTESDEPQSMAEAQALGKQQAGSRLASQIFAGIAQAAGSPQGAKMARQGYEQKVQQPVREYMQRKQAEAQERKGEFEQMKLDQARREMQGPTAEEQQQAALQRQARMAALEERLPGDMVQRLKDRGVWEAFADSEQGREMLVEAGVSEEELDRYAEKQRIKNEAMLDREKRLHQMELERAYAGSGSPGSGRVVRGEEGELPGAGFTGEGAVESALQGEVTLLKEQGKLSGLATDPQFGPRFNDILARLEGGRIQTRDDQERVREEIHNLQDAWREKKESENRLRLRLDSQAQQYTKRRQEFQSENSSSLDMVNTVLSAPRSKLRAALVMGPGGASKAGNIDPQVAEIRRALDAYRSEHIKRIAGARVSPEELERINSGLATGTLSNPDVLVNHLRDLKKDYLDHLRDMKRGNRAGAWYAGDAGGQGGTIPPNMRNAEEPMRLEVMDPDGRKIGHGTVKAGNYDAFVSNVEEEYGPNYTVKEVR